MLESACPARPPRDDPQKEHGDDRINIKSLRSLAFEFLTIPGLFLHLLQLLIVEQVSQSGLAAPRCMRQVPGLEVH